MAVNPVTVPAGSRVVVVVSTGALDADALQAIETDDLTMPDVLGMSQGAALEAVSRIRLRPRVIYDYHETLRKGSVMAQHPASGTRVSPDLESLLLVSSGPSINERVPVNLPNVVGMSESDAAARLRAAGLSPQFVHEKSATVPAGLVSAQIPDEASLAVRPKSRGWIAWLLIALLVIVLAVFGIPYLSRSFRSQTPADQGVTQVKVPDVVGKQLDDATTAIQDAGLKVGTIVYVEATSGKKSGTVTASTPAAGQSVAADSPVILEVVGNAPADQPDNGTKVIEETATVPDVSGLTEKAARKALDAAGFKVSTIDSPSETVKSGMVITQSPAAGAAVSPKSTVVIVLSSGAPADPTTVDVPEVVGLPVADATQTLQNLGLVVKLTPDGAAGNVTEQVPAQGSTVPKGSVVILTVAGDDTNTPPSTDTQQ
ncbi:MAG: PASTA domain-containing protein [Actinomycetes bacterium]|jgi:serine/threonine-protein kinase|nr:PASTA domain-containing protein [Actinomycetes bacterium]